MTNAIATFLEDNEDDKISIAIVLDQLEGFIHVGTRSQRKLVIGSYKRRVMNTKKI